MKLICWNIRHGGGKRADAIVERLVTHDADVIILTEFRRNSSGDQVRAGLSKAGWAHQTDSEPPPRKNGVMVASKLPISAMTHFLHKPPDSHRWLPVRVNDVAIIGTYFPSKLEKRPHWEYALYVAGALIDDLAMIVGDVNTGKHFLDEDRATFLLPEYIEKMECLGWNDAWRLLNPDGHESTWCSNAGNGFRLDHAYLSPQLQPLLQNAIYSHTEREDGVSDHSSYLIELA